jgi:NAD(P)-dependent dehydrogenase (short-subunit alcohol dehydrogenase family)
MSEHVPVAPAAGFGRLAGKTALVTGSTRGLGRVIAEWLALDGADIIVSGREADDVTRAVEELQATGVTVHGIPADLSVVTDIHRLAEETLAIAPELDILVNNAGMSTSQSFWECPDEGWDYQMNVNVRAPFVLGQHVARHWIPRGVQGRIVNVSTIGVFSAHRDKMVYNIAKAGIQAMTRNMSYELGQHRISVNCVAPGLVSDRPGEPPLSEEANAFAVSRIPLGRVGHANDIAAAVRFFCLPESVWTTGQTLLVDGGMASPMPPF